MCVVSLVVDFYREKWDKPWDLQPTIIPPNPLAPFAPMVPQPAVPPITDEEINEFRRLLERAREYDRKHNEPDCEMKEKVDILKKIAKKRGINISTSFD